MLVSNQSSEDQAIQPRLKQYLSEETLSNLVPDISISYGVIYIEAKKEPYRFVEFIFRKFVHVVAYGLLAVFAYIAWGQLQVKLGLRISLSLLTVFVIAAWDEWNQSNVASRTGAIQDVILDVAGGVFALTLLTLVTRKRLKTEKRKV